jgi:hypothetical protein
MLIIGNSIQTDYFNKFDYSANTQKRNHLLGKALLFLYNGTNKLINSTVTNERL